MVNKVRGQLRCAIYTRKSSEDGLEQDFNSLDAQREACEAYIKSQRHEGWSCLSDFYDDGGISGATLERPSLQRLLDDIKARKIDVVVVYKVDRLTRALADFAKIVEIFDAHNVSFVSVTQQFNTTSSMGRLTLNVLLSFAQFEREVTAERIRDKIAASKKKGMWMGGIVPLGYDAQDRTLTINANEAETVRALFGFYLELKSVRALQSEAAKQGLSSKNGRTFTSGHLYHLLQNPIYVGRIRHKEVTYPGQHPAIIDPTTWETVQSRLAGNRVRRRGSDYVKNPSPLAGRLFDDKGNPFTPTHAVKNGKRYRYYVERSVVGPTGTSTNPAKRCCRIAASEIESLLFDRLKRLLETPSQVIEALSISGVSSEVTSRIVESSFRLCHKLAEGNINERHVFLRRVIERITLSDEKIELDLSVTGLRQVLDVDDGRDSIQQDDTFSLSIEARLRNRGVELKLVVVDPTFHRPRKIDSILIKALIKANAWRDMLLADGGTTISTIAKMEKVTDRYVRRILELAFLAPDIAQMILDGRQPPHLSTEALVRGARLPLDWREQRHVLGL